MIVRKLLLSVLIIIPSSIPFLGCSSSYMNINDEFVEINKPGQSFGLIEIDALSIDSTFGYPSEEKPLRAMTLINRSTGAPLSDNSYAKVFFSKRNSRFVWRVQNDVFLADYIQKDTITIKPKTWYRLSKDKGTYNTLYFYWNGSKGDLITLSKPNPDAW
jgi:hypothetical protein